MTNTPIADSIRSEAALSSRPGQYERLMALAKFVDKMEGDVPFDYGGMYERANTRYQEVTDAVFQHLADGDVLGLLEFVGNVANGCDYVDDGMVELFDRAKERWS